jgi:hypothetical protein
LTREYIDGRRATYVSPIALFLFVIFLLFAVFSALGGTEALTDSVNTDVSQATDQAERAVGSELARARARLEREDDADDRAELRREIAQLEEQRKALRTAVKIDGPRATGSTKLTGNAEKRLRGAWQKAKENPQLLIYKLQTNAYKFSWLLIPISVPFVALTFLWRRKFGVYDHTIFTTYSITFMIALAFVATLVGQFVSGWLAFAILLYAPLHMYRQLRGTYALSRFSAFWRLIALSTFAWWSIAIFALLLIPLSE